MVITIRHDKDIVTEAIHDGTYQVVFKPHLNIDLFAGEHTEDLLRVNGHVNGSVLTMMMSAPSMI